MMYRLAFLLFFVSDFVFAQQHTILIIADDVSPDYFSFYAGGDTANTPILSSLAKKGVVFNRAWAYPVCSPTRSSIFTGRYGFRTGMGTVVAGLSTNQLNVSETSIASVLRSQSSPQYGTACVGKWHLHSKPGNLNNPSLMGYQYYSGNFAGAIPDYFNYERVTNGLIDTVTTYATTQTINDAISWLDTLPNGKPFFLWLAFNAPHDPFHKPPNALISNPSLPGTTMHINQNKSLYFKAAIEALDSETGRLIQYLDTKGLLDSTNFIFIGDNGSPDQVSQNPMSNRSKGTIYNYGVEVPMFIAGPAVVNPNRSTNALVSTVDLFPTIAALSNVTNWNPNSVIQDGRSLMSTLKNQNFIQREYIFSEQFGTSGIKDGKSIRNANYHLIRFDSTQVEEFYKISSDTFEATNLLLSIASMTTIDINNYHILCDSLSSLLGTGTCQPLSVQDVSIKKIFSVFPNPTKNKFSISLPYGHNSQLDIFDTQGRLVKSKKVFHNSTVDISDLSNSIYILQIKGFENIKLEKF